MGCGASTASVKGPSQLAEAGKPAARQEVSDSAPAPIAEDVQTVSDQELKKLAHEADTQGGAVGFPPLAPSVTKCDSPQPEVLPAPCPEVQEPDASEVNPAPVSPAVAQAQEEEAPQRLTPAKAPTEPQPEDEPAADAVDEVTPLVLVSSSEMEMERLASSREEAQPTPTALDPAVTPSSQMASVTLLPESSGGFVLRSRYTNESDLSFASTSYDLSGRLDDSDDDELDALFTLHAWKRYYGYNKNKHQDLLTYFWRKFSTKDYSCFCISYRDQDLLLTSYMAENCVNGFCARLEDLGLVDSLFLQMYVLHDFKADQFRILGVLLVQGASLPPQLAALSAFDGFVYTRADTSVTLIKQFVSALLVGKSPLNSLQLISGRELL